MTSFVIDYMSLKNVIYYLILLISIFLCACFSGSNTDLVNQPALMGDINEIKNPSKEKNPFDLIYIEEKEALLNSYEKSENELVKERLRERMQELEILKLARDEEWSAFINLAKLGGKVYKIKNESYEYYVLNYRGEVRRRFIIYEPEHPNVLH